MVRLVFLMGALGVGAAGCLAGPVVWLEAERFEKTGGWVNDSQFVDLMGSPYLLAGGAGRAVEDAVTQADVPAAAKYRLWVRCKNWLGEQCPGKFQVLLGGKASSVTFGTDKDTEWKWIDGGEFDLAAGKVEVRLHDLTGWWGRCDAVVLAVDLAPAADAKTLTEQRIQYGGLGRDVATKGPYDVVVVGGGLAGCAAAVASARHGCRVALIQDRPVLGGNASSEIQVPPGGDNSNEPFDPRETGIVEELCPPRGAAANSEQAEKVVRGERNIDLYLNTRATGLSMKSNASIRAIDAMDVHALGRMCFEAPLFIDCTGHGWVGFFAGAEFRQGREARSEFDEPLAPAQADTHTMGNSLFNARFVTHPRPVAFVPPPWAYRWKSPDDFETRPQESVHVQGSRPPSFDDLTKGKGRRPADPAGGLIHTWWVELGGMNDTVRDAEWIRDELFRVSVGLWDYVKNHSPDMKRKNACRELIWLNHVPGTRESRRLVGDYIMTQKDFAEKIIHADTVAYGGWTIDIHHPQGFWVKGPEAFHAYRYKVSIPYRILYSRNIENLMMAGRNVSVSHVALGGVRVMRTTCLMGQAAGTAAAIASRYAVSPREVYRRHVQELQQALLKDGCYLMGVRNADPRDLARDAAASASSFAVDRGGEQLPHGGVIHPLDTSRAVMFTAPADRIESIALFLRSDLAAPAQVKLALRAAGQLGDFSRQADLACASASVPPNSSGWVEFPLQAATRKGRLYYVCLPKTAGLKWDLYPYLPEGTSRAYGGPAWTTTKGCYKHRLTPGGEPARPASTGPDGKVRMEAGNVIDGWNRALRGERHAWAPDPAQPLPQWVQLDLTHRATFNCLHVTFQTLSHAADSFEIQAWTGDQWRTVSAVTGNTLRRRVVRFDRTAASRLRLVLTKAPAQVAVCEIRLYDEEPPPASG